MGIGKSLNNDEKNNNHADDVFRKHLDLNNKLKSSLVRLVKYIKKIHTLDDVEKKDVVGFLNGYFTTYSGVFSNQSWKNDIEQLRTIFDSLEYEDKEILNLLEGEKGLIPTIDMENQDISQFLALKESNLVERNNLIERLVNTYNSQKQRNWESLRNLLGQEEQYESQIIDRLEKDLEDMVLQYLESYNNLVVLILNEDNKNSMKWDGIYHSIYNIVQELSLFKGNEFKDSFINLITNKNGKKKVEERTFANNFFTSPNTFSNYFTIYNKEYENHEIYDGLPEEQKKQIDKLLAESLSLLFKGISRIEKKLKEKAEEEDEDFDGLKKSYKQAYAQLADKLRVEGKFFGKLEDCIIFGEDGIEEGTTLKDFEEKYLKKGKKNHDYIKNVTSYLRTLSGNNEAFKKFKIVNREHFNDSSSISDDDEDDTFKNAQKIDENNIESVFNEIKSNIGSQISLISQIIENKDNYDADKIKEEVRSSLNDSFLSIVDNLKVAGKNLNTYRSRVKSNWTEQILKSNKNEIKDAIRLINSDRSSSENIYNILRKVSYILEFLN